MKCMCCKTAELSGTAKFWNQRVPLCQSCHALAESKTAAIQRELDRTKDNLINWLEQDILSGRLLHGLDTGTVPEVQAPEADPSTPRSIPPGQHDPPQRLRPGSGVHQVWDKPTRGDQ